MGHLPKDWHRESSTLLTMPVHPRRIDNAYSEDIALVLSGETLDGTVEKSGKSFEFQSHDLHYLDALSHFGK